MRVAFLSYDFGEYCVRLGSALSREAEVLLVLPHRLAGSHLFRLAGSVSFRPFDKPRYRQPIRQLRTVYSILRWIRAFEPDVIHLQQGHMWFNLALPLLSRYPLVVTIHDPRHHLGDREGQKAPQGIMDFGFRRAAQVIVHGAQLQQVVVDQVGLARERVHVIPHIVLGDDADSAAPEQERGQILFFGRIWEYKGLEYLIRAEPLITERVPDAKIVIAGRGEDFTRYERMMIHPKQFVVHNEFVSEEKRAALFRQASVVVLPYIDATQSGVIPVAYSFSKPVVATTVGALPEMVEEGETGYLVPPRDERSLADALVRLLQDGELRQRMGAAGKRKIHTECSAETVAQKTLEVYRLAVKEK